MGSVSEVIAHGVNGFICEDLDKCVAAVGKVHLLKRQNYRDKCLEEILFPGRNNSETKTYRNSIFYLTT
jgi:hypothetical protein